MADMIDVVHPGPIAVVTLRRLPANAMDLEFTDRQLRSRAYEAIEAAIAGAEPLLNGWLSRETIEAAAAVLARA